MKLVLLIHKKVCVNRDFFPENSQGLQLKHENDRVLTEKNKVCTEN